MRAMISTAVGPVLDSSELVVHLPALERLATRLCGSREAGEDLVQDTVERVLRSPRRVDGELKPYLKQALRHAHVDRLRAAGRRPQADELIEDFPVGGHEDRVETRMEAHDVLRAVAALPDVYRDVVVAVDVQGFSYRETADRYEVPTGTVMSRLHRGRRQVVDAVREPARPSRELVCA